MSKLKIEYVNKEQLKPYLNNAKIHTAEQIEQIKQSIKEFSFNDPIAVWHDDEIIEGHGRLLAVMEMPEIAEVPVIRLDSLTDEQRRAYMLVHNKLTMNTDFDFELLDSELDNIIDIDMAEFGFDIEIEDDDEPDEIIDDEVPEEVETRCKLGDIWQLGNHRLICGDSTDSDVIDRLMDGAKADCVFTDPPYNMSADFSTSTVLTADLQKRLENIVDFEPETISWIKETGVCSFYIFTSKNLIPKYFEIFKGYDFNILVWCKDNPSPMTNYTFLPDIEYLLYFSKKGKVWNNGLPTECYKKYYNGNKLEGRKEAGNVHPTIKPLKIIADKIQISSNKDGVVLDLFGGSGSTLIACEQLNRKCYMAELNERYVSVIVQRWLNLTGRKDEIFCIRDGQRLTYDEVFN